MHLTVRPVWNALGELKKFARGQDPKRLSAFSEPFRSRRVRPPAILTAATVFARPSFDFAVRAQTAPSFPPRTSSAVVFKQHHLSVFLRSNGQSGDMRMPKKSIPRAVQIIKADQQNRIPPCPASQTKAFPQWGHSLLKWVGHVCWGTATEVRLRACFSGVTLAPFMLRPHLGHRLRLKAAVTFFLRACSA